MERRLFSSSDTIGEVLTRTEAALRASSGSPRLDAEVLVSHVLATNRTGLIIRLHEPFPGHSGKELAALLARRANGEPIAYILGKREFYGRDFIVTPAVLVPRPESELIIDAALKELVSLNVVACVDLGTGSGCLGISLVLELIARGIDARCLAVDVQRDALAVAMQNAEKLGVSDRMSWVESSWFSRREAFSPPYDCIIANPPYIDRSEETPRELAFEPQVALFCDDGGLRDTKEIVLGALAMLRPGGMLLCEVGRGKRAALRDFVAHELPARRVELLGDDSEYDRFTVVKVVV